MKKLLIIVINILLLFSLSTSVNSYSELGSAIVTAQVLPSYIIHIPPSMNLAYKMDDSYIGNISGENILLEDGYGLKIDIDHTPFISALNSNIIMPYTCNYSQVLITSEKDVFPLEIHVDDYLWGISPPGSYKSAMTFTISYVKL